MSCRGWFSCLGFPLPSPRHEAPPAALDLELAPPSPSSVSRAFRAVNGSAVFLCPCWPTEARFTLREFRPDQPARNSEHNCHWRSGVILHSLSKANKPASAVKRGRPTLWKWTLWEGNAVLLLEVHGDMLSSLWSLFLAPCFLKPSSATQSDDETLGRFDTLHSRCQGRLEGMCDPGLPRGAGCGVIHTGGSVGPVPDVLYPSHQAKWICRGSTWQCVEGKEGPAMLLSAEWRVLEFVPWERQVLFSSGWPSPSSPACLLRPRCPVSKFDAWEKLQNLVQMALCRRRSESMRKGEKNSSPKGSLILPKDCQLVFFLFLFFFSNSLFKSRTVP